MLRLPGRLLRICAKAGAGKRRSWRRFREANGARSIARERSDSTSNFLPINPLPGPPVVPVCSLAVIMKVEPGFNLWKRTVDRGE